MAGLGRQTGTGEMKKRWEDSGAVFLTAAPPFPNHGLNPKSHVADWFFASRCNCCEYRECLTSITVGDIHTSETVMLEGGIVRDNAKVGDPLRRPEYAGKKGWIARYGENTGRKKEYLITAPGKEAAQKELGRLRELTQNAEEILGDRL